MATMNSRRPSGAVLATEATIHTLEVTIKSLTVSGKQMTLAAFRQLPICDWKDAEGGVLPGASYWGFVRYAIKDQGDLWCVIARDDQLFRSAASRPYDRVAELRKTAEQRRRNVAIFTELCQRHGNTEPKVRWDTESQEADRKKHAEWGDAWEKNRDAIIWTLDLPGRPYATNLIAHVTPENYARALAMADEDERSAERVQRSIETWNSLQGLPQLFIAV